MLAVAPTEHGGFSREQLPKESSRKSHSTGPPIEEINSPSSSPALDIPIYVTWVVVKIMAPFLGTLNNRCRII